MLEQLYASFYGELQRYLYCRTQDYAAAEDIVQETFLRALCHGEQLETMELHECRAWLYRTAKNLMIDRSRRMKAQPSLELLQSGQTDFTGVEVESLYGLLSDRDRSIFALRYDFGYNASEIAEMFGMSPANVRMRLKAARTILKKELDSHD